MKHFSSMSHPGKRLNPGGFKPLIYIYIFNSYNWSEAYDFGFIPKVGVPSLGHMPLTTGVCTTEVGCVIIELTWSYSGKLENYMVWETAAYLCWEWSRTLKSWENVGVGRKVFPIYLTVAWWPRTRLFCCDFIIKLYSIQRSLEMKFVSEFIGDIEST